MNKAQTFWDNQARRFDDSEKHFEQANQELIAKTMEYLGSNDNVLDLGCGTGTKTLRLAETAKHIHGLDFSSEMISTAIKKKNELKITNVSFSQGTIFNTDLMKSSFERIVAYSLIHLLEESEAVIQRIHELLKPGGLFISETACFKEKMDLKMRLEVSAFLFMKRLGIFPLHLNMYKITDLEYLIISQNFKIIKAERLFYNGMTISFLVAEKL